ncbi:MAG: dethiobiotin synthase [Steroidobacteraceae bacterium]
MHSPTRVIGVLGTHTEVGKTWVLARMLDGARQRGFSVAARKPVQSFEPDARSTDADVLAAASGEDAAVVCPSHRSYPVAMAPPMAADVLGRPHIHLQDVLREITWPVGTERVFIETVGGPRSPLAHDADSVDVLHRLQVDAVILVADAGLGTLNAVRLSLAAVHPLPTFVFLNRFDSADQLHELNHRWLRERYAVEVSHRIEDALDHCVGMR